MQEDKVKSFLNILESLDNKSSLDEVVKAFEMVIELAKQTRDLTEEEIKNLRSMFVEAKDELKSTTTERFDVLKSRLLSEMTDISTKFETKLVTSVENLTSRIRDLEEPDNEEEQKIIDEVVKTTLSKIPPPKELKPETKESIREKLLPIEIDDVNNLKDELNIREQKINENIQSIRLMRGGGSKGIQLYVNGAKRGLAQYVDIVGGGSTTVSTNLVNGLHTITISSTGGAGFTELVATETPNGSRTQFTFATASAQPSFIVVDNVWMKATTATGGVNWTWNGGTKVATLTIPAVDDIWGVA